MRLRPRRIIEQLAPVTHGGFDSEELARLGLSPDDIIDFSVSTNPFMPPPGIREILKDAAIERYPDSRATALVSRLAERLALTPDHVLAGNGTTELIRLVAQAYFRQRDTVLLIEPTYGEYEPAIRLAGAKPVRYRTREECGFVPDVREIVDTLRSLRPRAVFLCNPNNPTGSYLPPEQVEAIADAIDNGLLIVDEAYHTFIEAGRPSPDVTQRNNVVIMRSMTKDYGLPGLRLGYAAAHPDRIADLRRVLPPWNVNAVAQAAGIAVLEHDDYLQQSLQQIREARNYLVRELGRLGYAVLPSETNYFLVRTGQATQFREALLRQRIMVRDGTSFGLPEHIRIAVRSIPDCRQLVEAMAAMKNP